MPHPRPTGAPDALSSRLRASTAEVHKEAEQRPFMRAFFAGDLPRAAYVGWLARQWHLYRTLEAGLAALAPTLPEHGLVPTVLYRTERIEADLDYLTDRSWRHENHLTPATDAYANRIRSAAAFPAGLVAHAWLRYMGNVGGRDVLRGLVAGSIGAAEGSDLGLAFTDYSGIGEIRPFFADFHAKLDALVLTDDGREQAVAEAAAGFRHNIDLTDELAEDFRIAEPPAVTSDLGLPRVWLTSLTPGMVGREGCSHAQEVHSRVQAGCRQGGSPG